MLIAAVVAAAPAALMARRSPLQRAVWRRCSRPPRPPTSPWHTPGVGSGGMCHVAVESLRREESAGEAPQAPGGPAGKDAAEVVKNIVETELPISFLKWFLSQYGLEISSHTLHWYPSLFLTPSNAPPHGLSARHEVAVKTHIILTHCFYFNKARRASLRRSVMHTNFLTPPVVKEAMMSLEKLAEIKAVAQGGYPQAERCRLSVGHPDTMATIPDAVAAVRISGNFGFEPCSHGDFLGAILGTGIVREKVGDILLQGEKGAQVLVVPELVDFLVSTLDKVGHVPVRCVEIPLLTLEYEPPRTKSFRTIEASLRVDALASAGFKISRSKLVDLISNGDVRVNWSPVTKNGATLKTGDVISVSGKGRLKIGEIAATKKGKFAIELIRYL